MGITAYGQKVASESMKKARHSSQKVGQPSQGQQTSMQNARQQQQADKMGVNK